MTPANITPCPTAVMAVVLNGQEHRITVTPGPAGRRQFEKEIRRLFSLSKEDELEFTFDCQAPAETASPTAAGELPRTAQPPSPTNGSTFVPCGCT